MNPRNLWNQTIRDALSLLAQEHTLNLVIPEDYQPEIPPRPELGDLAFPMFPFAKTFRSAPAALAQTLVQRLQSLPGGQAEAAGPYINIRYDRAGILKGLIDAVLSQRSEYGKNSSLKGQKILIEFSSPNTNKPLHLGHMRNNALGESTSRLLKACGAEVRKVNLFNDRGIHICKSMVAYRRWGQGQDPEKAGLKTDHYVGDLYVQFQKALKEELKTLRSQNPELADSDDDALWLKTELGQEASQMLRDWEAGDPKVRELWSLMNRWAIQGILKTYERTRIQFDEIQYEHQTYLLGKDAVLQGLEMGVFHKRKDGAVVAELPWKETKEAETYAQKVLLRADGTSIYLTQDLGTALHRHAAWAFDQAVYVVANEQDYHFKVLFHCLGLLGHPWAEKLYHLSYGLVNLPTGRMKTREGTVVDADDLLTELGRLVEAEIQSKGRENDLEDTRAVAEAVALGALHYFLLSATPARDMIFNPEESLSFNGNTGPYLQYTGARIASLLQKGGGLPASYDPALLTHDEEWALARLLERYPELVETAAKKLDPSLISALQYDICKTFSRWYHECPIVQPEAPALSAARLTLAAAVLQVLQNGFELLNMPYLSSM